MIEVGFPETVDDALIGFAVIVARAQGRLVFCKHRERSTYELPGGHREPGETVVQAAMRELMEETGAVSFDIEPVCVYSVKGRTRINKSDDDVSYGMLFSAEIHEFGPIESEIESILVVDEPMAEWTYPEIQPLLLAEAERRRACSVAK